MTNGATPYSDLNAVLEDLIGRVRSALGQMFVGGFLQGSFAVGDFDVHSDVDFIVVVRDELSADHVASLQVIHRDIYGLASSWAQHLEGSYFPERILRDYHNAGTPLWYLDHGSQSLVRSDHCNTVVVRWVTREHGIAIAGPDPKALVDPIPVDALRREIAETIRSWGQQILTRPEVYSNRFYQGYIVLNCCRMLHDLVEGFPGSKRAGAAWAKTNLDPKWSGLIDRAWDGRPDPAVAVRQPANAADFDDTLRFVKYVIGETEKYTARHHETLRGAPSAHTS